MSSILLALIGAVTETNFQDWLPYLRIVGVVVVGLSWGAALAVIQPDDVLAQLKAAIKMAGLSDKECAGHCGISQAHWSSRMSGVVPFSMHLFAKLPEEVRQWFYLLGNRNEGTPDVVLSAIQLDRRQAQISLATVQPQKGSAL